LILTLLFFFLCFFNIDCIWNWGEVANYISLRQYFFLVARNISKMFAVIGQYRFSVPIQMETRFLQFQIFALHEPYIIFKFIYSVTKTLVWKIWVWLIIIWFFKNLIKFRDLTFWMRKEDPKFRRRRTRWKCWTPTAPCRRPCRRFFASHQSEDGNKNCLTI
jgi:hypothetical protein